MNNNRIRVLLLLGILMIMVSFAYNSKKAEAAASYITTDQLKDFYVDFEKKSYAVFKGDNIILKLDTNIPSESYYTDCSMNSYCASAISDTSEQDKIVVSGNFAGEVTLTARLKVAFCTDNGEFLGIRNYVASTKITVLDVLEKSYEIGEKFSVEHKKFDNYKDLSYEISDPKVLKLSKNEFVVVGTGVSYVYLTDNKNTKICIAIIEGVNKGEVLSEKEIYLLKGSTPYGIIINNPNDYPVRWTSTNKNIALVDNVGNVTPVDAGDVTITATLSLANGKNTKYNYNIHVVEAKITLTSNDTSPSLLNVAIGYNVDIYVKGARGIVEWNAADKSIAEVFSSSYEGVQGAATIYGLKKGTTDVTATVDGVTLSIKVSVVNPTIDKTFLVVPKGAKQLVKLAGTDSSSNVKYKSYNKKVATVSKNGVIKTKAKGYCPILVTVDGKKTVVNVNVGSAKAVKAVQNALKAEGASYSQSRRMEEGYYDCSSLVWRSFSPVKMYFGKKKYAPVAADEARFLDKKKKTVDKSYIYKLSKLRTGDLLFYSGYRNGRYKSIRHVAIYIGQEAEYFNGKFYKKGKIVHANGRSVSVAYVYNESNVSVIGRPFK